MTSQPIEGAHLIGAFLSVTAFGLYTCLLLQTFYHLARAPIRSILIAVQIIMLWLTVLSITILHISSIYDAFITSKGTMDPSQYYGRWTKQWRTPIISILTQIACVKCNAFFCWRLYVMWKRSRKVLIIPGILTAGLFVCLVMSASYALKSRATSQYALLRSAWQMAFIAIGLTINVLMIGLMCWRIRCASRSNSNITVISGPFYHHAILVLIESGALYATITILSLVMKGAKLTNASVIFTYIISHAIGLTPTLIVLRIASSARVPEGANGHDTIPPTSQRCSISQPVFAHTTVDNAISQMSAIHYGVQSAALKDRILSSRVDVVEAPAQSNISSKAYDSDLDAEIPEQVKGG